MNDKIKQIMRKTYGYWWVDGMADLALGLFFGALASYSYLMVTLPLSKTMGLIMAIAEPLFFIACWWLYGRLVKWVKEHITYRRTGYVAYQPKPKKERARRAVIGGVLGFVMALSVTFIGPQLFKVDSVIMVGVLLGMVTLFLAITNGVKRLYLLAPIEMGAGWWVSTLLMDAELKSIFLMALIGVGWLLSGLIAFVRYLVKTKPLQEGDV
ncbi:MAG: hypothetical protein GYA18_00135 [Chloroflexi bacterium]|nr:hypothetical protein [Chloroflexota bacterium]